jgi:hypothetical protein
VGGPRSGDPLVVQLSTEQTVGPRATCVVQIQPLSPDTRSPQNGHQQAQADSSCPCHRLESQCAVQRCLAACWSCRDHLHYDAGQPGQEALHTVPARCSVGSGMQNQLALNVSAFARQRLPHLVPCWPASPQAPTVQCSGIGMEASKC